MATLDRPAIHTMGMDEIDTGIGPILTAFASDPVMRWFYADPYLYWTAAPRLVKTFAGRAFENGTAYATDDYMAAALWLPPGVSVDEHGMSALAEETVPAAQLEKSAAFLEQQAALHPHEPHWYLPMIGVDPMKQGRGYGTALLEHALVNCDRSQLIAYLESSNPRNKTLYQRMGFEEVGVIQANDSPPMFAMLRQPKPLA